MATTAYSEAGAQRVEEVILRRVPLAALVAAVAAIVANIILLLIGQATGAIGDNVELPNGQVFGAAAVISITVLATIGASVVYAIIGAIKRIRRPITVFLIVALGIFILMFFTPFSVPGVGAGFVIFLELMHVATAAAIVGSLVTLAGRRA